MVDASHHSPCGRAALLTVDSHYLFGHNMRHSHHAQQGFCLVRILHLLNKNLPLHTDH